MAGAFSFSLCVLLLQLPCVTATVFPYFVEFRMSSGKINCVVVKSVSTYVNKNKYFGDDPFYFSE